jgi:hypothetical protein
MRSGTEQSSTALIRHQATVRFDPMFENCYKLSVRPMLGPLHAGLDVRNKVKVRSTLWRVGSNMRCSELMIEGIFCIRYGIDLGDME